MSPMEHAQHPDAAFRELTVERLVLKEPGDGRPRAVLEVLPPRDEADTPGVYRVRLSLLDATGEPAIVAEVDANGEPILHVGHPDRGTTVTITPSTIDLWHGGNAVVSLTAGERGGVVGMHDEPGEVAAVPKER